MRIKEALASLDWMMTGATVLLLVVSLAMLFSTPADGTFFSGRFLRQSISILVALVFYFAVSFFPYHGLRRYAALSYLAGLVFLLVVSWFAPIIRGTSSRFELFSFQIQPSEFVKVAMVLCLAWFFARWGVSRFSVISSFGIVGLAVTLVILEPDFGQAALMVGLWAMWIFFLGVPWSMIFTIGLVFLTGLTGAWLWLFKDYQKARLTTFFDPTADPQGAGYNLVQSIVAIGSGGLLGRGLGHGPQSQLQFLPEQHTDFILASIGEELGFVGIALVVFLYMLLLWRIAAVARTTRDIFGQYLVVGVFILLLVSFFVSAGMNMGLLPVTGVPLPLVSYGGSNMVCSFIMLGFVQSVRIYGRWVRAAPVDVSDLM